MRAEDIEVGGVYENESGERREVMKRTNYDVQWKTVGNTGHLIAGGCYNPSTFARWAARRLTAEEVGDLETPK